jgi:alkanesulfonate monooxygenase SsuD/methylene tetrahydromethanopterin reductase-like flavin-dependent oxidoreductase (luciferase family)
MKVSLLSYVPYRRFEDGFEDHYQAAVTTPYGLVDPVEVSASFRDVLDTNMLAAECGFDGLAFLEHGQSSFDMAPNPSLMASAMAYATAAAGHEVALFPTGRAMGKTSEPLRMIEEYGVIDAISGGRLMAGLPAGLAFDACLNHGVAPIELRDRFEEGLGLMIRAWTDYEPFPFNGRFSQRASVNPWPRPVQDPYPPIWLMGIGTPGTMKRVAAEGWGYQLAGTLGVKVIGTRVFDQFWRTVEEAGQPANPHRLGYMQPICVGETEKEARELYASHVEYFFHRGFGNVPTHLLTLPGTVPPVGLKSILGNSGSDDFGVADRMKSMSFDELVEAGCVIVGSADQVAEELTAITSERRIGHLLAILSLGSMPAEVSRHNVEAFATGVLPRLRELWPEEEWPNHWWPRRLGGAGPLGADAAGSALIEEAR